MFLYACCTKNTVFNLNNANIWLQNKVITILFVLLLEKDPTKQLSVLPTN